MRRAWLIGAWVWMVAGMSVALRHSAADATPPGTALGLLRAQAVQLVRIERAIARIEAAHPVPDAWICEARDGGYVCQAVVGALPDSCQSLDSGDWVCWEDPMPDGWRPAGGPHVQP